MKSEKQRLMDLCIENAKEISDFNNKLNELQALLNKKNIELITLQSSYNELETNYEKLDNKLAQLKSFIKTL